MKRIALILAFTSLFALTATGCAAPSGNGETGARSGSGIEMFGTIDASVSTVKNK